MSSENELIRTIYQGRDKDARKYDYGLVIVIGGSKIYTGSPALSALAAVRAGADIAQIIAPTRVADVAASFTPDLITFPLEGDYLAPEHLTDLLALTRSGEDVSRGRVAVVLGGGVGRDEKTKEVVRDYLKKITVPVVVDADGIYAFEETRRGVAASFTENKKVLFTPHAYEFYVLTGKNVRNLPDEEKKRIVKEEAQKISATILLKGETDFISDGVRIEENNISVPEMSVGGTGDVLAGIAGALLARGLSPFDAGRTAVAINCLAGKAAAEKMGDSLLATDVIEKIHQIIKHP